MFFPYPPLEPMAGDHVRPPQRQGSGMTYLIWSHEHGAWWGPGRCGYTRDPRRAGRYSRVEALKICTEAIPGDSKRLGALPELPVREDDLDAMISLHEQAFGKLDLSLK
jgi:hypothetical protein